MRRHEPFSFVVIPYNMIVPQPAEICTGVLAFCHKFQEFVIPSRKLGAVEVDPHDDRARVCLFVQCPHLYHEADILGAGIRPSHQVADFHAAASSS